MLVVVGLTDAVFVVVVVDGLKGTTWPCCSTGTPLAVISVSHCVRYFKMVIPMRWEPNFSVVACSLFHMVRDDVATCKWGVPLPR